jgi:hypothetical protein
VYVPQTILDLTHALLTAYKSEPELKLLKPLVFELFEGDDNLLQLIVDCTKFHFMNELYTDIERLTSSMCFALHLKRSNLIG